MHSSSKNRTFATRSAALTAALLIVTQACASSANDDLSATVRAGLQLTRNGQLQEARTLSEAYLASAQGTPSSPERCAMLLMASYSNALLHDAAKGQTQLGTFDADCHKFSLPFGWHTEAGRVRRLLNGENPADVYAGARGMRASS